MCPKYYLWHCFLSHTYSGCAFLARLGASFLHTTTCMVLDSRWLSATLPVVLGDALGGSRWCSLDGSQLLYFCFSSVLDLILHLLVVIGSPWSPLITLFLAAFGLPGSSVLHHCKLESYSLFVSYDAPTMAAIWAPILCKECSPPWS